MSHFFKSSALVVSSFFLVVAFQNCGQPGSVSAAPDLAKSQAPLVVDVVGEMQNQEHPEEKEEPKHHSRHRHGKKDDDHKKHRDHDDDHEDDSYGHDDDEYGHDNDKKHSRDDREYGHELEEVLARYSCDEQVSSRGAKNRKVMICHYPVGDAKARHEICVSRSSLDSHLHHGHGDESHQDHLGHCEREDEG